MSAPSPLSVVIVDDDEFVAQSLRTILEARGSVRVAGLGTKGAEAAALFNEHHPDIMLLDIRMPDLSGLAAGEAILAAHPKARIVFLTAFAEGFTQRERDIAELIAEGLDNREIAQALYLSEGTVRNHISAILQKCGLRNRTQIAIAWWR